VLEQRGAGIIQVAESYQDIQTVQRQLIVLLAISVPLVTLLASAGGWFLASSALNPIDRITRAATQIGASDLSRRLNLNLPDDEVGRLAATFDQMLARLDAAFERQKRFIADASHEMRTPLTILKGEVEVALNRPRTAKEYRETLEQVNQTTNRLTALVEELLLLARADNRQYPLQVERFDLAELLSDEINYLTPRATDKAITLNLAAPDHLILEADPDKLARLFMNLIDNAIKYSEAGDTVRVSAGAVHDGVRVEIKDTGPGIPAEHLPHLFDRFYRVDKARARQLSDPNGQGGAGLGLSIAQWLAEVHGGRIDVTSHPGHGTTFSVHLPFTPPAEEL
jgi:heavy metal sensor kinase